jgi:hypothetical protein
MNAPDTPSAGEARKATQEGTLPVGSVQQILEAAPKDLKEEVVEVPEWGYSVKIRSSSAAQQASIKEDGFKFTGEETQVAWGSMEIQTFQQGVVEPKFDQDQVAQLYISSGPGFNRVVNAINSLNNVDQTALEKAKERFQGQGGSA